MSREPIQERTAQALEWPRLVEGLAGQTRTRLGAAASRMLKPRSDVAEIRHALAETSEARLLLSTDREPEFAGVQDLDEVIKRVRLEAVLDSDELIAVARLLRSSRLTKQTINESRLDTPLLYDRTRDLVSAKGVEHEILNRFDERGRLLDDASPELERLRFRQRRLHEELTQTFDRILADPGLSSYLQEHLVTIRSGRYVIPVKIEHKGKVDGIVHDISSSGASLFIEPKEVTRLGNELRTCELQIQNEEARILRELTDHVAAVLPGLRQAVECLVQLDLIFGKARLALRMQACEPEVGTEGYINLVSARHPLLVLAGDEVVPNDVMIPSDTSTLVITGPNTGGKTVLLKTLGLYALMVRSGLHLPCRDGSEMALYGSVFADIGDEQSLEAHLSSFSAHLENIKLILNELGDRSLVLLDEVGEGTDPRQGIALATALLEMLANRGCRTIVTTHFLELAALADQRDDFTNGSVEFDQQSMSPTYRFLPGVPGRSSALSIARKLGLPAELVDQAESLVDSGAGRIEEAIQRLDQERQRLIEESKAAADFARQAAAQAEKQREITGRLRRKREQLAKKAAEEIRREADRARQQIRSAVARFKSEPSDRAATRAREEIRQVQKRVVESTPSEEPKRTIETVLITDWSEIKPGDEVVVTPMNSVGRLIAGPGQKNEVRIQLGAALITCSTEDVALPAKKDDGGGKKGEVTVIEYDPGDALTAAAQQAEQSRLDLRGMTADEALAGTEAFLDRAVRSNQQKVTIIHGHGTGVLKSRIREYLSSSPYVKSWRPGERGEGGGGVAIVELEPL